MKAKSLLIALTFVLSFFIWSVNSANAVIVSPVVVEHELAPGMSVEGVMRITNEFDNAEKYYVTIQSFSPKGEEGQQEYLPEDVIDGLPSWVNVQSAVTVNPRTTEEVPYKITAPIDAEPGGHYASIFYSTTPPNLNDDSGVGIAAKTGIIFLIKISGDIIEYATIESFESNQKVFSHLPAMMSLRIRNNGNVHFRPQGTLEVRNMWGGVVARLPANPSNGAVLPNSIRRLNTWWAKSNDVAEGGFMAGLTNEWRNFALGKYTATVNAKYGEQNKAFEAKTVSFWVIPWRMLLILIVLLAIFILGMKMYNKAIVNAALNKKSLNKKK
ncbi:hypothetical protein KKG46_00180 [Patescibacteria group bacterium]|nr:hypothetical protein [Patescibacteria group bacterium]